MDEFERFFRELELFMEEDFSPERMDEFERGLESAFERSFFHTFRKTIELCRRREPEPVPEELHLLVIRTVRVTAQVSRRRKPRRKKA